MKKIIFLFAAAAMLSAVSCGPKKTSFVLEGTAADSLAALPEAIVLLYTDADEPDTLAIENGTFKFEGEANSGTVYTAYLSYPERPRMDRTHYASFIPEGGKVIKVTLADSSFVNGSPLTDALTEFNNGIQDVYAPFRERIKEAYASDNDSLYDAVTNELNAAMKDYCMPAIKANSNNAIGVQALSRIASDLSVAELKDIIDNSEDAIKNDERIQKTLESKIAEEATVEGQPFADFEGKNAAGETVKFSDYVGNGHYTFVDFFASWCGPCMKAVPEVKELNAKFGPKGLKVVGVNVWENSEEAGPKCVAEKEMTWDIIYTYGGTAATDAYGITGIPTALVIGPDGTIVKRAVGYPLNFDADAFFTEALSK